MRLTRKLLLKQIELATLCSVTYPSLKKFPYLVLHRRGLHSLLHCWSNWWSLTPPFHPYRVHTARGGMLSVALLCRDRIASARPNLCFQEGNLVRHPAIWCSDFPQHKQTCAATATARLHAKLRICKKDVAEEGTFVTCKPRKSYREKTV